MRRRDFITVLGGAVLAWPSSARAQQPAVPIVGFLNGGSPERWARQLDAFRQGLKESGYVEGQSVTIEYRWAESQYDRLPAMAAELVGRRVAVIAAAGANQAVLAAKAATATIPIVFATGADPVRHGLVTSLNRPGGNLTGVTQFTAALEPKRLELLHELVPNTAMFGVIVNPNYQDAETQVAELEAAARALGRKIVVVKASSENDIDAGFATLVRQRVGALVVASDPFLFRQRNQIVALAARHALPAVCQWRDFAVIGGLMSYGTNVADAYHQVGIYTGRILKGANPADLPVVQSTRVDLVINMKTAKTLGLTFPITLLGRADEVIE